ncbi:hypothetical protein BBJ28_00023061 [Nothophytophthora sp. Chile5]|nr:hypothetical protein BBJ28_00023061 [Nothophytophthora sp. Chile5]
MSAAVPASHPGGTPPTISGPPGGGSVGPGGPPTPAFPLPTSALDLLSSTSSALTSSGLTASSPPRTDVPTAVDAVPSSSVTSLASSVAVASDCLGGADAQSPLLTPEPYQGPSLSREARSAALQQSHLLQMLDQDCRQLEGVNAALVRQNRALSDRAATLYAQNLQHTAALEVNRDRDCAADFYRQQSSSCFESWWDAEEELKRLVQELEDVRASNDDLDRQLFHLRRSSDIAYHDLQEELWAERDIFRRLSRDSPDERRSGPGRASSSASTPLSPALSTTAVVTSAAAPSCPSSAIPAVIGAVLTYIEPPASSQLVQQLAQAQEAEQRARNASEQASSRRELAEKVATGAEKFVIALRGELSAANARGDGYNSSFDLTVEQRKTDASASAQRRAVLGKHCIVPTVSVVSNANTPLCVPLYFISESQLKESQEEAANLRTIVTQNEVLAGLVSRAEQAEHHVTQLQGQLRAVVDDRARLRAESAAALDATVGERDAAEAGRDSASAEAGNLRRQLTVMTARRDLLERRIRVARNTLLASLTVPDGPPSQASSSNDDIATSSVSAVLAIADGSGSTPAVSSTVVAIAAPSVSAASAISTVGTRSVPVSTSPTAALHSPATSWSSTVAVTAPLTSPLAPPTNYVDPSLPHRFPRMGERYVGRRLSATTPAPRVIAYKSSNRRRSPSPLDPGVAPSSKRRKGGESGADSSESSVVQPDSDEEKALVISSGVPSSSPPCATSTPPAASIRLAARGSSSPNLLSKPSRQLATASSVVAQVIGRRGTAAAGGAPDGDDDNSPSGDDDSSPSGDDEDGPGGPAVAAGPASGSDDDDAYGVVDGPATDVEDATAAATSIEYTLMPIEPFLEPCLPPRIDVTEWDDGLEVRPWDKRELGRHTLGGVM